MKKSTMCDRRFLAALLLSLLNSVCAIPDCYYNKNLTDCTTRYLESLTETAIKVKDDFCVVLHTYYLCVTGLCGGRVPDGMDQDFANAQHHYFACGINMASKSVSESSVTFLSLVLYLAMTALLYK